MMSLNRILPLLIAVAAFLVACASNNQTVLPDQEAQTPAINELTSVSVDAVDGTTTVSLAGSRKLVYNVFRMSDPQRLLVDIADCKTSGVPVVSEVNDGLITVITTNEFSRDNKSMTRVMIGFKREAEFSVREDDATLKLLIAHPEGFALSNAAPEAVVAEQAAISTEPETAPIEEAAPIATVEPFECPDGEAVVIHPYGGKASKGSLTSLSLLPADNGIRLSASTTKPLSDGSVEVIRLCDPDRLVVDFYGLRNSTKKRSINGDGEYVSSIRLGSHAEKLRVVLDMAKSAQSVDVDSVDGKLSLALLTTAVAPTAIAKAETPAKAKSEVAPVIEQAAPVQAGSHHVLGLDFKHQVNSSTVEIKLTGDVAYRLAEGADDQLVLELPNTTLPANLEQSLDTSEFDSPVTLISSYVADEDSNLTKVVVQTRNAAKNSVRMEGNTLMWRFDRENAVASADNGSGRISLTPDGGTVIEYETTDTAGLASGAAELYQASAKEAKGQRISLELKNTDILDVLRLIADVSKLNIIASDDVRGSVTVRLLNVPWQQALDIILRSKGLGKERQGNIIRVAPMSVLQRERELRINQLKAQRELEPLSVRLIPVSYANASAMVTQIRDLLSARGTSSFDERTNVIIVKDIDEVLSKAESLVSKLDLQTPQVMIEAKIVEANISNDFATGIQWGGYYTASQATGNATGLAFPSSVGLSGAQDATSSPGIANTTQPPNWIVNVPSTRAPAGGIGLTLGSANNTANLTLRLAAMESSGKIKIISSPRISTLDNTSAKIEQGVQIPITSVSSTGIPVSKMVEANLSLDVTPHITADGSIIMKLKITKQEPDFSRTNALGDPAVIQKEATTEVLVRTGETTVIGGIYTKSRSVNEQGVPLFSKIPILGWLFKGRSTTEEKTELLIFVTPRIINRSQSSLAME